MGDSDSNGTLEAAFTIEKEHNPKLYAHWPYPAVWTHVVVYLLQHPGIPMHLLYLSRTAKLCSCGQVGGWEKSRRPNLYKK